MDYYQPELIPDSSPQEKPPSVHRFILDMAETLLLAVVLYVIIQSLTAAHQSGIDQHGAHTAHQ